MIKQAKTMVALAAMAAAPAVIGAQAATTPPPAQQPATCDCPVGDARGNLRDLAAFAPLGLLGALAAAGGTPLFAAADQPLPATTLASSDPVRRPEPETPITEAARITGDPPPSPRVTTDVIPEPVSPDSLRGGIRAPNTGTPLPSVFLIGSGLVAIGCVTLFRTRG